jgi:hypothetical protein
MTVNEVTGAELPEGATHGFKIADGDETLLFFHWNEDPAVGTNYEDVLVSVGNRLKELGYEDEIDAVLGEVVGRFGAGA